MTSYRTQQQGKHHSKQFAKTKDPQGGSNFTYHCIVQDSTGKVLFSHVYTRAGNAHNKCLYYAGHVPSDFLISMMMTFANKANYTHIVCLGEYEPVHLKYKKQYEMILGV